MKNLYICICLFFCGTLFAISTKENEMILQTRELKQQWENASTGIVGDNRKIDLEKIEQLQKEYAISLVALITYAIKEDNFEQDNSLLFIVFFFISADLFGEETGLQVGNAGEGYVTNFL